MSLFILVQLVAKDIILALSSTTSSPDSFQKLKEVIKSFVFKQPVSASSTLIGVLRKYSPRAVEIILKLGQGNTRQQTMKLVDALPFENNPNNLKSGDIFEVSKKMFSTEREVKSKSAVVFFNQEDVGKLPDKEKKSLTSLKDRGVHFVFVVIGKLSEEDEHLLLKFVDYQNQIVNPNTEDEIHEDDIIEALKKGKGDTTFRTF